MPPTVPEIFRLSASTQPTAAVPLGGRGLQHGVAGDDAYKGCMAAVSRQLEPSKLASDPVPRH
jgi:hypothetical protein